ncbi:hypothetical protein LX36DRAFT_336244 [Colletotrichum falcatum]|nr:hypothetical protein LX36DRAFT_336244 [Colletotrichum falcatum]
MATLSVVGAEKRKSQEVCCRQPGHAPITEKISTREGVASWESAGISTWRRNVPPPLGAVVGNDRHTSFTSAAFASSRLTPRKDGSKKPHRRTEFPCQQAWGLTRTPKEALDYAARHWGRGSQPKESTCHFHAISCHLHADSNHMPASSPGRH